MNQNPYTIERVNFRGEGIAASIDPNRRAIRIPNALCGETVWATEIPFDPTKPRHAQYNIAYLRSIASPSPLRVDPICRHWRRCALCQYACVAYETQAKQKFDQWTKLIDKFVNVAQLTNKIEFKSAIFQSSYRNRCEGVYSNGELTIPPRDEARIVELEESSHSPQIPLHTCQMHTKALNRWISDVQNCIAQCDFDDGILFSFEANGDIPGDRLAKNEISNARLIAYAPPANAPKTRDMLQKLALIMADSNAAFIFQELPPRGSHVYPAAESFGKTTWYAYDIDAPDGNVLCALNGAWTPVNPRNAHLIRQTLGELIENSHFKHICEIGCGCGTHTGVFVSRAERYTGIDASWPAIQSAQFNARRATNWENASFYTDTAEHYLDKRYYKGARADAVVLHSNRLPYSARTAELCKRFGARDLFVVAPTAYALAQECRRFIDLNYRFDRVVLCDTLPMSYHMMGVAHLALDEG